MDNKLPRILEVKQSHTFINTTFNSTEIQLTNTNSTNQNIEHSRYTISPSQITITGDKDSVSNKRKGVSDIFGIITKEDGQRLKAFISELHGK